MKKMFLKSPSQTPTGFQWRCFSDERLSHMLWNSVGREGPTIKNNNTQLHSCVRAFRWRSIIPDMESLVALSHFYGSFWHLDVFTSLRTERQEVMMSLSLSVKQERIIWIQARRLVDGEVLRRSQCALYDFMCSLPHSMLWDKGRMQCKHTMHSGCHRRKCWCCAIKKNTNMTKVNIISCRTQ